MTLLELVAMRRVAGWLADPESLAVVSAIAACRLELREEDKLAVQMYERALRIRAAFPPLDVDEPEARTTSEAMIAEEERGDA